MKTAIVVFALLFAPLALGQAQPDSKPAVPAANPADVKSIESIVAAVYDVISGPAGQKRDWNRFRSLFWPSARLAPLVAKQDKSGYEPREFSVEGYITRTDPFFVKEGFYENAVANRVEQWAQLASVFSSYESRHAKGEKPFARGINSIQLFNDGQRWWVLSILWQAESEQNPLPALMLRAPGDRQ